MIPGKHKFLATTIFLSLQFICTHSFADSNYWLRFKQAFDNKNKELTEEILKEWEQSEPRNPQLYVGYGNYFFWQAKEEKLLLSKKPPEDKDIVIQKPDTKEVVGSISPVTHYNPELIKKAVSYLGKGLEYAPYRLDIYFGLAHIFFETDDFSSQYKILARVLGRAKKDPEKIRWIEGKPLPSAASTFIPENIHHYTRYHFEKQNKISDKRAFKLAKLNKKYFPRHIYPINDIGLYYSYCGNFKKALKYFLGAHQIDEKDQVVLVNIGESYLKLGKTENAKKYFEKIVTDIDPYYVEYAKQKLLALEISNNKGRKVMQSELKADIDGDKSPDLFRYTLGKNNDDFDASLTITNVHGETLWRHQWKMNKKDLIDDLLKEEGGIAPEEWVKRFFTGPLQYGAGYQLVKLISKEVNKDILQEYCTANKLPFQNIYQDILRQKKNFIFHYRAAWREDLKMLVYAPTIRQFVPYSYGEY